jgi:hypothetical protein
MQVRGISSVSYGDGWCRCSGPRHTGRSFLDAWLLARASATFPAVSIRPTWQKLSRHERPCCRRSTTHAWNTRWLGRVGGHKTDAGHRASSSPVFLLKTTMDRLMGPA